jgi:hypothetical protein
MGTKSMGRLKKDGQRGTGPWYGITYRVIMPKICRGCGVSRRRFVKDVEICTRCAVKYRKATRGRK